ncbi:glycerol-3-phosphate acyltransferase [Patulibacter sp. SYSU D01012]|uniref:glycerol-3-phosphate acyltransferase n=1 Tax=Patulibacter sp. SYSU D01012 TaxID=2817381 RepID=UPI001B30C802|nr:glycerol-3-phosphate acyltransferase [Patulibacter sp. SYSU D01012]
MEFVLAALAGYLLGSIPAALLVGRAHGVDLYAVGDGNPGAWNALEQLGPRRAWPAFVGDGLKGTAAGAIGWWLGGAAGGDAGGLGSPDVVGAYVGVAAAMVGHALPVFARFRGGKAVMTFAGGAFALSLPAAAIALAVCAVVSVLARSFAVGARVAVFGFPVVQLAFAPDLRVAATGGLMGIIGALFLAARLRRGRDARRGR